MIKLLNANYDKQNGVSEVTILTELGKFTGVAHLHPEDKKIASTFLGCEIAEYRATISYFEKVLYKLNIEISLLKKLPYNKEIYKVYKQKTSYRNEVKDNIKSLKNIINNKIENRTIIIEQMKKLKEKRKKKD